MMGKYDDIIDLPHHVSERHPQMPAMDRAAQFSPFAALTGHRDMIAEAERLTEKKIELEEGEQQEIMIRLQILLGKIKEKPEAAVTYFVPDEKKSGGSYRTVCGAVIKVDGDKKQVVMENGTEIPMEDICKVFL
ncbi:hypothetical protein D7X98_02670 [bacterium 1XD8-76]|nr:hypothetical protein D7X98_02670 [bacterium 1XD8-76]